MRRELSHAARLSLLPSVGDPGQPPNKRDATPNEPGVILARALAALPLEPNDAIEQHDLAGEGWAVVEDVAPRLGAVVVDPEQERRDRRLELEHSVADERVGELAALAIGRIGHQRVGPARPGDRLEEI